MIVLIILLIVAIIFFIVISVFLLSDVRDIKNIISFDKFKKFYDVEPGYWELRDNYVKFYENKDYHWGCDYTNFRFNLIDTWKYSWFNAGIKAQKAIENELAEKEAAYKSLKKVMSKYEEET